MSYAQNLYNQMFGNGAPQNEPPPNPQAQMPQAGNAPFTPSLNLGGWLDGIVQDYGAPPVETLAPFDYTDPAQRAGEWGAGSEIRVPPVTPYSSVGSQTRLDELPPSAATPAPFSFSSQDMLDQLQFAQPLGTQAMQLPQTLDAVGRQYEKLKTLPVVGGILGKGEEVLNWMGENADATSGMVKLGAREALAPVGGEVAGNLTDAGTTREELNRLFFDDLKSVDDLMEKLGRVKEVGMASQRAFEKENMIGALAASMLFDPLNLIPGANIGGAQKFRKVAEATKDVTKIGEAMQDAPLLARLWDKFAPLARAGEGELLDIAKLGIDEATGVGEKIVKGANPFSAFQKTPLAKALDFTQRAHDWLLPQAASEGLSRAQMVDLLDMAAESAKGNTLTDALKTFITDRKLTNSADFQRAIRGALGYVRDARLDETYNHGQQLFRSIDEWTQTARPTTQALHDMLMDTRPFQEAFGDAEKMSNLSANQRGAFQRFAKVLDAYESGAGGASKTEVRAAVQQLNHDLEVIGKMELASAWVDNSARVVKSAAKLPDEAQLAERVMNKIRAYESALLLAANPHYVAQNVVSDWVRLAMHGVNPMESAQDISNLFGRAFGTGDMRDVMGEIGSALKNIDQKYIPNAPLGLSVPQKFGKLPVIKQLGDFNQLMNERSRVRAFYTGFVRAYKANWKYGTTLPRMPAQLEQAILNAGGGRALKSVIKKLENSFNAQEMREALKQPFPMWEAYADTIAPELERALTGHGINVKITPDALEWLISHGTGENVNAVMERTFRRAQTEGMENFARIWDEEAAGIRGKRAQWQKTVDETEADLFGGKGKSLDNLPTDEQVAEHGASNPKGFEQPAPGQLRVEPKPAPNAQGGVFKPDAAITPQEANEILVKGQRAGATVAESVPPRPVNPLENNPYVNAPEAVKPLTRAEADLYAQLENALGRKLTFDEYTRLRNGENIGAVLDLSVAQRPDLVPDYFDLPPNDIRRYQYENPALNAVDPRAFDYLMNFKKPDGTPEFTAQQLATWKPQTIEQQAIERGFASGTYAEMLELFKRKTGKDAEKYLVNLLNAEIKRKGFYDDAIGAMPPFGSMADVQKRASDAHLLLRGYNEYPTLAQGEFMLRLRLNMAYNDIPANEFDAIEMVVDAWARAQQKKLGLDDVDVVYRQFNQGLENAPFSSQEFYPLKQEGGIKGSTSFFQNGRSLMRFAKGKADALTYLEEMAHGLFFPSLDDAQLDEVARFVGLQDGAQLKDLHFRYVGQDATLGQLPKGRRPDFHMRDMAHATSDIERYTIAQEKFAKGFLEYVREGNAPTSALAEAFEAFKGILLDVWDSVVGKKDFTISDNMRQLYKELLDTNSVMSPADIRRIEQQAIREVRGELAQQGLGYGAHLQQGLFDPFFKRGTREGKDIWQYRGVTEGMTHTWYPISNGKSVSAWNNRSGQFPPFASNFGPNKQQLQGTARKDWVRVAGHENNEWSDFVLEHFNQQLGLSPDEHMTSIDDLLNLIDENLAHNNLPSAASLYQRGKRGRRQMDMFADTGRVDDLPLFSQTPQTVKESAFVPPENPATQGKLFDTRPEFGGTQNVTQPIAEMPGAPPTPPAQTAQNITPSDLSIAAQRMTEYTAPNTMLNSVDASDMNLLDLTDEELVNQARLTHDTELKRAIEEELAWRKEQAQRRAQTNLEISARNNQLKEQHAALLPKVQAQLRAGNPIQLPTYTHVNIISRPEHIRVNGSGVQIATGRGKWVYLTEPQVEDLARQLNIEYGKVAEQLPPTMSDGGQFSLFQQVADRLKKPEAVADPTLKADVETALADELLRILRPVMGRDMGNYGRALDLNTLNLLESYIADAEPAMNDMKNAAQQIGRWYHQHTAMDYSQRWNVDDAMNFVAPFTFYPLHMAANFGQDFLDKPALFAMYTHLQNEVDKQSKDLPARFQHRIKIPMPFLPDWMGDGVFVDPFATMFPARQVFNLDDLERATFNSQNSDSQQGKPLDNVSLLTDMYSPHLPYKLGYQLLTGDKESLQDTIANLPPMRMLKAAGAPYDLSIAGFKPLQGKWDEYYLQRAARDAVADGTIDEKQMKIALLTRKGETWGKIVERSRLQNYTAPVLSGWAGFTGKVYPAGEIKYNNARMERDRLEQQLLEQYGANPNLTPEQQYEFLKSKGEYDGEQESGVKGKMRALFDQYPELESGAAMSDTEQMYRDYLKDGIWEQWQGASALQKKLWKSELGEPFASAFMNKDTRAYDEIPTPTLLGWANALKVNLPDVTADLQTTPEPYQVTFPTKQQQAAYDTFRADVEKSVGWENYYAWNEYYQQLKQTDKQSASAYLKSTNGQKLIAVWDAQDEFYKQNPGIQTMLEKAGAIAIRRAEEKTTAAPGTQDAQKQAWGASLNAVGYTNYDEYKKETDEYFALPKGSQARRDYLAIHPRLARQWAASRAIYGDENDNANANASRNAQDNARKPYTWKYRGKNYYTRYANRGGREKRVHTISYGDLWRQMGGAKRPTFTRIKTKWDNDRFPRRIAPRVTGG